MVEVLAGVVVIATEESPANTATHAVVEAGCVLVNKLAAGIRHGVSVPVTWGRRCKPERQSVSEKNRWIL